jgi:beta-glucosidase
MGLARIGQGDVRIAFMFIVALLFAATPTAAADDEARPWMNPSLSPDARADLVIARMTTDEKIAMVHGYFALPGYGPIPKAALGSAGYVPGIERLGVPALQETDASLGVANPEEVRPGDRATPLPSGLALAATWNPDLAYQGGAMIGYEAWRKGFNVLLAGGVNLARDPRNGRNFEYLGEDALLAGILDGRSIAGIQSRYVLSTVKHFALNDQETGRHMANVRIADAAARESDLLAFQLAIEGGAPGSVMCAYNLVAGDYACENKHLLTDILRGDWGYPGFVMSDWGAVYGAAKPAIAGLDQESGQELDKQIWFGAPLQAAIDKGEVPAARLDQMVHRILRSAFDKAVFDHPPVRGDIDDEADAAVAQSVAEQGIVLLKNDGVLPLSPSLKRIAIIGAHADVGVLSGGGSSQVIPTGDPATMADPPNPPWKGVKIIYDPSSPLKAIQEQATAAAVVYDSGRDPGAAAKIAAGADVAIVFADQWMAEGLDAPDLTLPNGQDRLIATVAAANPHTVVVLETGGPVQTPWLSNVAGLLEAWYAGARGGTAIADILFGRVNPSGRLPVSFPANADQLPRPRIPGGLFPDRLHFDIDYVEGAEVGYRWYAAKGIKPLFPFGFGLSYTEFSYTALQLSGGASVSVGFDVTNRGPTKGAEVAQIYGAPAAAAAGARRLIGWKKIDLRPGETQHIVVDSDPRLLAHWDEPGHGWRIDGGDYHVSVGSSSEDAKLTGDAMVDARSWGP